MAAATANRVNPGARAKPRSTGQAVTYPMSDANARSFAADCRSSATRRAHRPDEPPLVAIVSKADRHGGGASLVAEDLADLLNRHGHRAEHWLLNSATAPRDFQRIIGGRLGSRIIRRFHWFTRQFGLPDVAPVEFLFLRKHLHRFAVVHFHDCSSAIANHTVRWTARRRPTAWTFHDCSPFTAGCLYPMDCRAFQRRCGRCPQLDRWPLGGRLRFDFTGGLQAVKRRTAAEGRFVALAPSHWMAEQAVLSGMFAAPPRVVPNFVDVRRFRPRDRAKLRAELGLASDRPWVLVTAGSLADPRKGVADAISAVARCGRPPGIILVGRPDPQTASLAAGIETRITGFVASADELAQWYAAADCLLFPSRADNLPCTILEAMACGTPTIGYAVGGVPDLIETERHGRLVPCRDTAALATALAEAIDHPESLRRWGEAARRRAESEFSEERFLSNHLAVYRELSPAAFSGEIAHTNAPGPSAAFCRSHGGRCSAADGQETRRARST